MDNILEVKNLYCGYDDTQVIKNINFTLKRGEILGFVGESGSGKSSLLKAIMQLKGIKIKKFSGEIIYNGKNIEKFSDEELRKLRNTEISVIFQNPHSFFNPIKKIKKQFEEVIAAHEDIDKNSVWDKLKDIFNTLNLKDYDRILDSYPFELSGGMAQRVAIALAVMLDPKLILADEPTSALDVTVEMNVVNDFKNINKKYNTSFIIITHNIGVVANLADKIAVLYMGRVLEYGDTKKVLKSPIHPYTKALIESTPKLNSELPKAVSFDNFDYTKLEEFYDIMFKDKKIEDDSLYKVAEDHYVAFIKICRED